MLFAQSKSINVYLKFKPQSAVVSLVEKFNQHLEQGDIYASYGMSPFLKDYSLHLTLFLSQYDAKHTKTILRQMASLAKKTEPVEITTKAFVVNAQGYVMLSVMRSKVLHRLSNQVVFKISYLHDSNAKIPAWAADDPQRNALFNEFGSPGILGLFNPHFSIIEPKKLSANPELQKELERLINTFSLHHSTQITGKAYAIGVGLANKQGQIIKELAEFKITAHAS